MNLLLIYLGKLIFLTSKILRLGAGATWPGEVALKLNKSFLRQMANQITKGVILISGTNGKTTTAYLTADILRENDLKVLHNISGANLLNGLASSFIINSNMLGKSRADIAVFEIDEANLPKALQLFTPKIIILLNLSRDQLDRYGEVEIMRQKWAEALKKLPTEVNLVINKDNQRIASLGEKFKGKTSYFSLNDLTNNPQINHLLGKHNKLNALATMTAAKILNVPEKKIDKAIRNFKPAFGRGEEIIINEKIFKILLAKNPASFNINLETIIEELPHTKSILFILNDNIPDGSDVSWIYDIKSDLLNKTCQNKKIFVSGKRAADFALRLKYAGLETSQITHNKDLNKIITTITEQAQPNELILILPTYSAMLETRKILCGKKIL